MLVSDTLGRRGFLEYSLTFAAANSLISKGFGQTGPAAREIASGVHLISGAGSNAVLFVGTADCVLVDTGSAQQAAALAQLVTRLAGGKPVSTVFNTCFDEDNTGGNGAFRRTGAKVIAHENTRLWMAYEFDCDWRNRRVAPRKGDELPTDTFFEVTGKQTLKAGGEEFEYGLIPQAHTDGDIYILAKNANVLMAGGLICPNSYPVLDYTTGGWIGGMNQAAKRLAGMANATTKAIGSRGPVVGKKELDAQAAMLDAMYKKMQGFIKQGFGASDIIAAKPTAEFDATYGDPSLFMKNMYPGLWAHARELGSGVV